MSTNYEYEKSRFNRHDMINKVRAITDGLVDSLYFGTQYPQEFIRIYGLRGLFLFGALSDGGNVSGYPNSLWRFSQDSAFFNQQSDAVCVTKTSTHDSVISLLELGDMILTAGYDTAPIGTCFTPGDNTIWWRWMNSPEGIRSGNALGTPYANLRSSTGLYKWVSLEVLALTPVQKTKIEAAAKQAIQKERDPILATAMADWLKRMVNPELPIPQRRESPTLQPTETVARPTKTPTESPQVVILEPTRPIPTASVNSNETKNSALTNGIWKTLERNAPFIGTGILGFVLTAAGMWVYYHLPPPRPKLPNYSESAKAKLKKSY